MENLAKDTGQSFINAVFKDVHTKYDKANDAMSFFLHRKWKKDFVSMLNIKNHSSVLDLASGTGDIAKLIKTKTNNVTLCDISVEMLEIAKLKVKDATYVVSDAKHLPFHDKSFDFVTCAFGVRNFEDISRSIMEAHRIIKPCGIFAIMEFLPESNNKLYDVVYKAYLKYILPGYDILFQNQEKSYTYLAKSIIRFLTKTQIISILQDTGFHVISPTFCNGMIGVFLCTKI